ncbi:MAG: M48 family metallopeptidase [Anaerolineales bacterium]|nr:M48 family metallopeptidase [Anaerolineales bacterium]
MEWDYKVIYSDRKTLSLVVERDRSIVVRAPKGTSEQQIQQALEAKKLWLYKKLNHPQKYPEDPVHKEFVTGESLLYLGRNYRLEISDEVFPGVRFQSRFYISRKRRSEAGRLLREWYVERAREKLPPRIGRFADAMGVTYNQIRVSDLKYRWASCTPKNNLNFNWRIIKAPMSVVDYLIVHELAHVLQTGHSDTFWNIVAVQVPDYERSKEWLRDYGHLLEEDF